MLAALAEASAHGVVHGALKPENVLLGAGGRAKVADFRAAGTPRLHGARAGAEQDVGPQADLYATGVIAYELSRPASVPRRGRAGRAAPAPREGPPPLSTCGRPPAGDRRLGARHAHQGPGRATPSAAARGRRSSCRSSSCSARAGDGGRRPTSVPWRPAGARAGRTRRGRHARRAPRRFRRLARAPGAGGAAFGGRLVVEERPAPPIALWACCRSPAANCRRSRRRRPRRPRPRPAPDRHGDPEPDSDGAADDAADRDSSSAADDPVEEIHGIDED